MSADAARHDSPRRKLLQDTYCPSPASPPPTGLDPHDPDQNSLLPISASEAIRITQQAALRNLFIGAKHNKRYHQTQLYQAMANTDGASNDGTLPKAGKGFTPGAYSCNITIWLSHHAQGPPLTILAPDPTPPAAQLAMASALAAAHDTLGAFARAPAAASYQPGNTEADQHRGTDPKDCVPHSARSRKRFIDQRHADPTQERRQQTSRRSHTHQALRRHQMEIGGKAPPRPKPNRRNSLIPTATTSVNSNPNQYASHRDQGPSQDRTSTRSLTLSHHHTTHDQKLHQGMTVERHQAHQPTYPELSRHHTLLHQPTHHNSNTIRPTSS